MKLDHHRLAEKLDHAYALVSDLDRDLALVGLASWPAESPRRVSLAVLEHLADLRTSLDRITVAADVDPLRSPYVRRDLVPNPYTRAAARAAGRLPPESSAPHPPSRVLGTVELDTGDEDRPPSIDKGTRIGDSAAVTVACWPSDAADVPSDTESEPAPVALLATL